MVNNLILRPARIEDAADLHLACWPGQSLASVEERLAYVIARQEYENMWGLVAVVDGQAVGYGQLARWGRLAEISDLIVNEGWRGRGIGAAIIRALLKIACQNHFEEVEIGVAVANSRAERLYQRLGFTEKRRAMLVLNDGPEPVIYLSMRLEQYACDQKE